MLGTSAPNTTWKSACLDDASEDQEQGIDDEKTKKPTQTKTDINSLYIIISNSKPSWLLPATFDVL